MKVKNSNWSSFIDNLIKGEKELFLISFSLFIFFLSYTDLKFA